MLQFYGLAEHAVWVRVLPGLVCRLARWTKSAFRRCVCVCVFIRLVTETWSHFPWARERLLALLAGSGAKTPVLLSGDTHYAEFAGTPQAADTTIVPSAFMAVWLYRVGFLLRDSDVWQ